MPQQQGSGSELDSAQRAQLPSVVSQSASLPLPASHGMVGQAPSMQGDAEEHVLSHKSKLWWTWR